MESKIDIRTLSVDEIADILKKWDEKPFRAKQIYEWLWKFSVRNFEDMTNLSLELRQRLNEYFEIRGLKTVTTQKSADTTIKCAFRLFDGKIIEGVLIPTPTRMTACVSSQVGCSLNCKFCATGYLKRERNLDAGEIYDQVIELNKVAIENYGIPLSNIVYMGMGEPMLNYHNVLKSVEHLTSEQGLGMASKRITVSTSGIAKMIMKLADDNVKFNLALSLHEADNIKRSAIMPINDSNPLEELQTALQYFYSKTKNQITLEYVVINNTNDSVEDALNVVKFASKIPKVKVNLIEYNPIDNAEFKASDIKKMERFASILKEHDVLAVIRRSRGKDIDAACGQLANKTK
ncbi:MAG: 23S rRNA (adenine(2503)-C(2))-methyltransferase RlmN [Bacteroidetes bacterium]|nr:23S rRNA (adenine(2503)-C(2))-methyltransferase RlmN [Bacteroidota bacterium]